VGRTIYAVDVGSTRCKPGGTPNFGWARVDPEYPNTVNGSSEIGALADAVVQDLSSGNSIALGFEAPLFIPVPELASKLCHGRTNEGSRSFAAPAGLAVTTLGIHQSAWLLRHIARRCNNNIEFRVDPEAWPPSRGGTILFCWEAFVSDTAHGESHVRDAATAVIEFMAMELDLAAATKIVAEWPLSLIGAVALWSGLSTDITILAQPTVVIRPKSQFLGRVQVA
jgi:hypothetical protein